jgi:hypothetical protein
VPLGSAYQLLNFLSLRRGADRAKGVMCFLDGVSEAISETSAYGCGFAQHKRLHRQMYAKQRAGAVRQEIDGPHSEDQAFRASNLSSCVSVPKASSDSAGAPNRSVSFPC